MISKWNLSRYFQNCWGHSNHSNESRVLCNNYRPICLLSNISKLIEKLIDCNWTQTQNHLVRKRTLNHLAKLAKWLSCVLSTYLYGAFDCMFLSCHVYVSEWIHTIVAWMSRDSLLEANAKSCSAVRVQLQSLNLQISQLW